MQELENITNEEIDNKSDIVNDLFEKLNSEDLQKVLGLLGGSLLRVVTDTNYLSKPVLPSEFTDDEIDKILKAKDIVRNMVNYPDTLVFHDLYTKVSGNVVTLKFTCKNGFGVPETRTLDIKVN